MCRKGRGFCSLFLVVYKHWIKRCFESKSAKVLSSYQILSLFISFEEFILLFKMNSKSVFIRVLCLTLSVVVGRPQFPVFLESRPPPSLPIYGPQIPYVSASVKSPPVIAAIKTNPHIAVPAPPVRARIGVKTVVRPQPQPIIVQQPVVQQPLVIEQHELVTN